MDFVGDRLYCIVNIILFSFGHHNSEYLIKFSINGLLSLAIGFIIWHLNLWTAGDAKLFFSYSLLLPLNIYKNANLNFFPALSILFYAFVPFAVFLILMLIIKTIIGKKFDYIKKIFNMKNLFMSIVFIFAFIWIIELLLSLVGLKSNIVLLLLLLILLHKVFNLINLNMFLISIVIALLRFIFDKSVFSIAFIHKFLIIVFVFTVLRYVISNLGYLYFTKNVKIDSLKEGTIPAENIVKLGKQLKKIKNINSFFKEYHKNALFKNKANGLSAQDIINLRKITKNSNIQYLKVYQTVSFSPFLFISVLLIIIVGLYP